MNNKDKDKHSDAAAENGIEVHNGEVEHEEHEHKKKKKKDESAEDLKKALEGKEKEIAALRENQLYQLAEFENFKKLKLKEKQDALRFGNETLIKELLPVIDNLERAIEHAGKSEEATSIVEGVTLTLNAFLKVLEKFNVSRIEAKGARFDPNLHEAVYQEENDTVESGTVVAEFQKGYVIDGRLVRPSMVSVAKGPERE
jgi:molecular chaperone GrpE